jgi:hypothetical protein
MGVDGDADGGDDRQGDDGAQGDGAADGLHDSGEALGHDGSFQWWFSAGMAGGTVKARGEAPVKSA